VSTAPAKEPDHIKVQHILIGFQGTVRGKNITRTQAEAKTLAYSLLDSAKAGVSFDDLVARHTDDQAPGIYGMANTGVTAAGPSQNEYGRGQMVAAFGNVGFKLAVGEVGIADYDPTTSPFGYHVIKRVE
jgi:parvulin-like peptidyl-prolyl isomerase